MRAIFAGTNEGIFVLTDGGAERVAACPRVRDFARAGEIMLAAGADGVYRSHDGGRRWQRQGLEGLEVWALRGAPGGDIYAVTQPAGLYRSDDDGITWTAVETLAEFPGAADWCVPIDPPLPGRARALVVDSHNPARLWVGVEVGGILRSTDGGAHWQMTRPGGNPDIHMLVAHPEDPDELFVSTGYGRQDGIAEMVEGNAGVFRSRDGGTTWQYAWAGITPRYTRPLCIDPRPPYPLTVACAPSPFSAHTDTGGAGAMIFRSDDRGASWRSLCDAAHTPSAANFHGLCPAAHGVGDVLAGTDTGELWRIDAAAEWTLLASGLPAVLSVCDDVA